VTSVGTTSASSNGSASTDVVDRYDRDVPGKHEACEKGGKHDWLEYWIKHEKTLICRKCKESRKV
jgi:hypothetical protein